jgi:hypothetical protein
LRFLCNIEGEIDYRKESSLKSLAMENEYTNIPNDKSKERFENIEEQVSNISRSMEKLISSREHVHTF